MGITDYRKINSLIAKAELLKFVTIPNVKSVFADAYAEDFLVQTRHEYKPFDHGKKTEVELYQELEEEFFQVCEKQEMSVTEFYNSKTSDERARKLLCKYKKRFDDLETNLREFSMENKL